MKIIFLIKGKKKNHKKRPLYQKYKGLLNVEKNEQLIEQEYAILDLDKSNLGL